MFNKILKKHGLFLAALGLPFLGFTASENLSQSSKGQEVVAEKKCDLISSLILERLQLSKDLATYQWNEKMTIDNLEQESLFISDLEKQANQLGLDQKLIKDFFSAQLEASKMIAIENFDIWVHQNIHKHDYTPEPKALEAKIKDIDSKLLTALKDQGVSFLKSKEEYKVGLSKTLQDYGFSREVIDSATHF